jgi:hypothetical protein
MALSNSAKVLGRGKISRLLIIGTKIEKGCKNCSPSSFTVSGNWFEQLSKFVESLLYIERYKLTDLV